MTLIFQRLRDENDSFFCSFASKNTVNGSHLIISFYVLPTYATKSEYYFRSGDKKKQNHFS